MKESQSFFVASHLGIGGLLQQLESEEDTFQVTTEAQGRLRVGNLQP